MSTPQPTVLVYCDDLYFSLRIQDVVEKLGGRVRTVSAAADLAEGLADAPVLALIEVGPGGQGDWVHAVHYARKFTRGVPIVAFAAHVDTAARDAARQAGCDHVWSKNRFMAELPAVVAQHLTPPADLEGCADAPNALVQEGLRLFNAGQYYPCHDALEKAWMADHRPCRDLYQGILQLAIALHHIEQGHFAGADKMFRRAITKFQRLPGRCQGLDVTELLRTSRRLHGVLLELGPERIGEFPRALFPVLSLS
jgi:predicted metal-dependent hydrolase